MPDSKSETPPSMDDVFAAAKSEMTPAAEPATEAEEHVSDIEDKSAPESADPDTTKPSEEPSFTEIDPRSLPPELKKTYKDLQAGFTRKMQELSAQLKTLQSEGALIDAWKPAMELYRKDATVKARVDRAFSQVEDAAREAGVKTADEFETFLEQYDPKDHDTLKALKSTLERSVTKTHQQEIAALKAEIQQVKGGVEQVSYDQLAKEAAAETRRFEKKHPTWEADLTDRQKKLFFMELRENPQSDPAEVYESLRAEFDSITRKTEAKTVAALAEKAGKRVNRPSVGSASEATKVDSLEAAFKAAKSDLGIR